MLPLSPTLILNTPQVKGAAIKPVILDSLTTEASSRMSKTFVCQTYMLRVVSYCICFCITESYDLHRAGHLIQSRQATLSDSNSYEAPGQYIHYFRTEESYRI